MPARVLHVIDLRRSSWPAAAALAQLQRAEAETGAKGRSAGALAFGEPALLAAVGALGARFSAARAHASTAAQALALAREAKRLRANIAHAWCGRSLGAAVLAGSLTPGLRVSGTVIAPGEPCANLPLRLCGRISVLMATERSDGAPAAPAWAATRCAPTPPWRAWRLDAQKQAWFRARWGASANAAIIAHLGEPEAALDAHAFASVILALRLLGIDAFGVTSARARSMPAGVDLASRLAGQEILAFEPLPPPVWLGACDAALWGAFHDSIDLAGAGRCGARAALKLGIPVAAAPQAAAIADDLAPSAAGAGRLIAAPGSKSIGLAGALRSALALGAPAIDSEGASAEDAQRRAAWLQAHENMWESLAARSAGVAATPLGQARSG